MHPAILFNAFLKDRFSFSRHRFLKFSVILGALVIALTGFHLSSFQQSLADGIKAGAIDSNQLTMGIAHIINSEIFLVVGSLSLILLAGFADYRRDKKYVSTYLAYLATQNFEVLAATARGLETDAATRELIVSHLSRRRPGWSYF